MTQSETQSNGHSASSDVLLEVKNMKMYFPVTSGIVFQRKVADVKAVDGIGSKSAGEKHWAWPAKADAATVAGRYTPSSRYLPVITRT